jgi:hypothetical protein
LARNRRHAVDFSTMTDFGGRFKMIFLFHLQSGARVVRNLTDWVFTNKPRCANVQYGSARGGEGSASSIEPHLASVCAR